MALLGPGSDGHAELGTLPEPSMLLLFVAVLPLLSTVLCMGALSCFYKYYQDDANYYTHYAYEPQSIQVKY